METEVPPACSKIAKFSTRSRCGLCGLQVMVASEAQTTVWNHVKENTDKILGQYATFLLTSGESGCSSAGTCTASMAAGVCHCDLDVVVLRGSICCHSLAVSVFACE